MRVAYVTPYDARDVAQWSGLGHYIGRAMEGQGLAVDYVGPVRWRRPWWARAKGMLIHRLTGQGYWAHVEPAALDRVAAAEGAALAGSTADVVLGLAADHLARLRCEQPVVLWSDAPLAGLLDSYDYATRLSRLTLGQIRAAEQAALDRCAAVVYTSDWAADVARRTYGVDAGKLHVIPFGANLDVAPTAERVASAVAARPADACRLLFLGVDWARKGGDLALAATRLLRERGVPATLLVVGCEPPAGVTDPFVERLGFISKRTAEGRERIAGLLASSHFLLLPTRAEAFGLVFAEASAHGVPSITTDVGGVGGAVTDGANGYRLPFAAGADAYADVIAQLFADRDRYRQLCRTARQAFDDRLNWGVAGAALGGLLARVVATHRKAGP